MNKASKLLALFCAALLVACAGCGGRSQVSGKVVFEDGTPLTYGTVNFVSADVTCKGQIESDGTFKMRTFKPGDGVQPGTYKVYLTDTLQFGAGKDATTKNASDKADEGVQYTMVGTATNTIPPEYSNPDQSPFEQVTVKGAIKDLTLTIKAAAPAAN